MSSLLDLVGSPALKSQARQYENLLMGVTWVETGLAIILFACWNGTIWRFTQKYRPDYWLGLFTFVISCVTQVFLTMSVSWSTNHFDIDSFDDVDLEGFLVNVSKSLKYGYLAQLFAIGAQTSGKLCIVVFLNQVIGDHRRSKPKVLYALAGTNLLLGLTDIVLILTECNPTKRLWDVFGEGTCPRAELAMNFSYFAGSWSAFTCFVLAIYPIPIIWQLQLQVRTKIGLCFLMSFGILAGVCAAIKTTQLGIMDDSSSITYSVDALEVAVLTEQWITFCVACVPPAAPLIKLGFSKLGGSANKSKVMGGSEAARKRTGLNKNPTFGPKSMNQFQSLAYAAGTVHDMYEMYDGSSKENIVYDPKDIMVTKNVDIQVQYEPKADLDRASGGGHNTDHNTDEDEEATTFDRV